MLQLSWDLFVIVVFAVIIAYSFIIGRQSTLKIIIGSYLAILTADGIGNLFKQYALGSKEVVFFMKYFGFTDHDKTMILIKVGVFIAAIVIIAIKGNFDVKDSFGTKGVLGVVLSMIFGFLSAGLVVSTLLIYVSGASFVGGNISILNGTLEAAYKDSQMIQLMMNNYNLWFAVPAVVFLISSLFNKKETV